MARTCLFVSCFLVLALLLPACQQPAQPAELVQSTAADEIAIRESLQRNGELWNAADVEGVLAEYAEDAVLMPPEAPAVVGKEALRTSWSEFLGQNTPDWHFTIEDIRVSGDLGFVRGEFAVSITEKESNKTEEDEGKSVFVFQRQSDGTWKTVIEIFNSNVDDDDDEDRDGDED